MARIIDIFAVWPTAAALARDIGASEVTVRQWRNRSGRIPVQYWPKIRAAALLRDHEIPLDWFVEECSPAEA